MTSQTKSLEKQLMKQDPESFIQFDLNGQELLCRVLRVHDTDTITVGFKLKSNFYRKNLRITGIDSPELHSRNAKEAKLCRLGREYLKQRYLNKIILVKMGPDDKYGRTLADIFDKDSNEHINAKLVECKFARAYGGDLKKVPWDKTEVLEGIAIAGGMNLVDPGK
jgi:endonuclease YncB( thermonuclease family)